MICIHVCICTLVLHVYRVYALPVLICSCLFLLQQVNYVTKTAFRTRGYTIKNLDSFTSGVVVLPRKWFALYI